MSGSEDPKWKWPTSPEDVSAELEKAERELHEGTLRKAGRLRSPEEIDQDAGPLELARFKVDRLTKLKYDAELKSVEKKGTYRFWIGIFFTVLCTGASIRYAGGPQIIVIDRTGASVKIGNAEDTALPRVIDAPAHDDKTEIGKGAPRQLPTPPKPPVLESDAPSKVELPPTSPSGIIPKQNAPPQSTP